MNDRDSNYNGNLKKYRSLWSAVVRENFLEEIEFEEDLEEWKECYWIERGRISVSGLQVVNKGLEREERVM